MLFRSVCLPGQPLRQAHRKHHALQPMPGRVHRRQAQPAVVVGVLRDARLANPRTIAAGRVGPGQAQQGAGVLAGRVLGQVVGVDGRAEAVVGGD